MSWEILQGDALERLREMPDKSVHCVCTSPPYYGLRDYGTAAWEGGDEGCEHVVQHARTVGGTGELSGKQNTNAGSTVYSGDCACGARRVDQQIGLEQKPEEYVGRLVEVFREVRRVLRDDGTCWVNLGDSYSGYHGNSRKADADAPSNKPGYIENMRQSTVGMGGLKPKDLIGIPWMVAFALRADGWYLRSDIIWAKSNPMPESVTDRPTKSHEYIFLLTKSEHYFYDAEAIKEPSTGQTGAAADFKRTTKDHLIPNQSAIQHREERSHTEDMGTRNKRSVWTINTQPFNEWTQTSRLVRVASDAVSGGMMHIVSPGCPQHGDLLDRFSMKFCDERASSALKNIEHTDNRLFQELSSYFSPTAQNHAEDYIPESSDWLLLQRSLSAIARNTENRKMVPVVETIFSCNSFVETLSRIDDKPTRFWLTVLGLGICGSNIFPVEISSPLQEKIPFGIADKSESYMPPCLCIIYERKTEKTSHFATWPPKLVEIMVKAGTSEKGCCPACGSPWRRVVERMPMKIRRSGRAETMGEYGRTQPSGQMVAPPTAITTGWQPTCSCLDPATGQPLEPVPCTVLDPFSGAATTGLVALSLGRHYLGIELNPEYIEISKRRLAKVDAYQPDLFTESAP